MSCCCRIRAMVSEVPLMYGTVAIVTVVSLVSVELSLTETPGFKLFTVLPLK